jgi:hypothetical protein
MLKRIVYLGYYLKKMDWPLLRKFLKYVSETQKRSYVSIIFDMFFCVFKYNISLIEYFQFRFFELDAKTRSEWAGSGFQYEVVYKLNLPKYKYILEDKYFFLKHYSYFVKHHFYTLDEVNEGNKDLKKFLDSNPEKMVLKHTHGQCGRGIEVINGKGNTVASIKSKLEAAENNLLEEFVQQHDRLNELSPAGLNTLRIVTLINKQGGVDILGIRLRITVGQPVDNLAAGNIAAFVDPETGIISTPAIYSDITKPDETVHPITGKSILGFEVPFFKEAKQLAIDAALHDTSNKTIGWDIAITNKGPELIEGNHDWCKLLWQLPAKKGLKHMLINYA